MARELANHTNVEAPSANFPRGRIKDDSGAGDGTPVDEKVYGDFHQFFAKLMADAGVVPNDLPECKEIEENNRMGRAALCWSSHEEIPHAQGKRNPSRMVGVARGHQRANTVKPYSQKTSQSNHTRTTALSNSMKLSHACGATQWVGHGREI